MNIFELSEMPFLERPIDTTLFVGRTVTALHRAGYNTIGDIAGKTRQEIMDDRNLSENIRNDIFRYFDRVGVAFAGEGE